MISHPGLKLNPSDPSDSSSNHSLSLYPAALLAERSLYFPKEVVTLLVLCAMPNLT